jgi:NAD(P)-dependent dehydrogenase (short-subunit alcohol dehydrogenase family)
MTAQILVVGGTGAFGQRLVESLLATTDVIVLIGGRNPRRHQNLIQALKARYGEPRIGTIVIDRDAPLDALCELKPFCVVDAAGPFQGREPHLAKGAIAAGCHYVDLADARDFVAGFMALDAAARAASVLVATGASSTPALSGAVLAKQTEGWKRVDEIAVAISPGNRAPRGLSVVEAILAYAGQPVRVKRDGRWIMRPGWGELVRRDMPGLGRRWLSLCETPDLDLLPARYPCARTVLFRAGLELPVLHLGLWLLTLPVRLTFIRSLGPYAALLQIIASWFEPLGTDRGGMSVEASGIDQNGRAIRANWSIVAEAGDGPNIPILPALALIRGLLDGRLSARGARVAGDLLSLEGIENQFGRFRITMRRAYSWPDGVNLFEKALGHDIACLPAVVRDIHTSVPLHLTGRAAIDGAQNATAKIIARLFRFPSSTPDETADVLLKRSGDKEVWIRRFGRSFFRSTLKPGDGPRRVYERFGPFDFELEITPDESGFDLKVVGWRMGAVQLPLRLAPCTLAKAFVDGEGRYGFDVTIGLPLIGRLVRYSGWLVPEGR